LKTKFYRTDFPDHMRLTFFVLLGGRVPCRTQLPFVYVSQLFKMIRRQHQNLHICRVSIAQIMLQTSANWFDLSSIFKTAICFYLYLLHFINISLILFYNLIMYKMLISFNHSFKSHIVKPTIVFHIMEMISMNDLPVYWTRFYKPSMQDMQHQDSSSSL